MIIMPYADPEKQKEAMRKIVKNFRKRTKQRLTRLKKENIELKKTINLMRIEHYPHLPLIELDEK
jgi:hypothetical protein